MSCDNPGKETVLTEIYPRKALRMRPVQASVPRAPPSFFVALKRSSSSLMSTLGINSTPRGLTQHTEAASGDVNQSFQICQVASRGMALSLSPQGRDWAEPDSASLIQVKGLKWKPDRWCQEALTPSLSLSPYFGLVVWTMSRGLTNIRQWAQNIGYTWDQPSYGFFYYYYMENSQCNFKMVNYWSLSKFLMHSLGMKTSKTDLPYVYYWFAWLFLLNIHLSLSPKRAWWVPINKQLNWNNPP